MEDEPLDVGIDSQKIDNPFTQDETNDNMFNDEY
jgi:hypothetical protein